MLKNTKDIIFYTLAEGILISVYTLAEGIMISVRTFQRSEGAF